VSPALVMECTSARFAGHEANPSPGHTALLFWNPPGGCEQSRGQRERGDGKI